MIRVLVAEDSMVVQQWLVHILQGDPAIEVIGRVGNGEDAVAFVQREKPDVITMDINMPKLDGIEATRRIMETTPVPIVVVSSAWNPAQVATTFRALEAGALALIETPSPANSTGSTEQASNLVQTVKNMSEVRVVRRWARKNGTASTQSRRSVSKAGRSKDVQVVAIGVSTGGPPVLRSFLSQLPEEFPVPILIVQHMASGFVSGLVDWLVSTGCNACIAEHGCIPKPGWAYLAPDGFQMGLDQAGAIALVDAPLENGLRPSASYLFRAVAEVWGPRAVGILLTGMGRDGAAELKAMRDSGATTFAQDRESSVVHGMPGAAIRLEAATYVLPPEKIAATLVKLVNGKHPEL